MAYIFNRLSQKNLRRHLRKEYSLVEKLLWNQLRNRKVLNLKFRRQYGIGNFVVDFCCPEKKLVIEADGDSHFLSDEVFVKDKVRQKIIEDLGFKIVRFTNKEIVENIDGVVEEIIRVVDLL